jgi:transcriptional regulator with XRE-family HTH domain
VEQSEDVLDGIGDRLRRARQDRGLTLEEVRAATGISVSTLSRLEGGQRRATLELVVPLARRYGVALDDLVAPPRRDPRVRARAVERDGLVMVPLSRHLGELQAWKIVLTPARAEPAEPRTHEGFEWLFVLAGRVRLRLGDDEVLLEPGEAVEFDTRTPHWFGPEPGTAAEVLSLFGPQGRRVHMRTADAADGEG